MARVVNHVKNASFLIFDASVKHIAQYDIKAKKIKTLVQYVTQYGFGSIGLAILQRG